MIRLFCVDGRYCSRIGELFYWPSARYCLLESIGLQMIRWVVLQKVRIECGIAVRQKDGHAVQCSGDNVFQLSYFLHANNVRMYTPKVVAICVSAVGSIWLEQRRRHSCKASTPSHATAQRQGFSAKREKEGYAGCAVRRELAAGRGGDTVVHSSAGRARAR